MKRLAIFWLAPLAVLATGPAVAEITLEQAKITGGSLTIVGKAVPGKKIGLKYEPGLSKETTPEASGRSSFRASAYPGDCTFVLTQEAEQVTGLIEGCGPQDLPQIIVRDFALDHRFEDKNLPHVGGANYCESARVFAAPDGLISAFIYPLKITFESLPGVDAYPGRAFVLRILNRQAGSSSIGCEATNANASHEIMIFENSRKLEKRQYDPTHFDAAMQGLFPANVGYRLSDGDELHVARRQTFAGVDGYSGGIVGTTFRAFFYCGSYQCVAKVRSLKP